MYYNNGEKMNMDLGPMYPFNTWTSIGYLVVAPLVIKNSFVGGLASILLGVISILWWYYQNKYIQRVDLGVVTFFFLWPILHLYNVKYEYQLASLLVAIIATTILLAGLDLSKYLLVLHIILIGFSLLLLVKGGYYIPLLIFVLAALFKFSKAWYGTGVFHLLTAAALLEISKI